MSNPPAPPDDDAPLDPAALAALIDAQQARVRAQIDVDGRLLFGVWGIAWLVGFGAMGLTANGVLDLHPAVAGGIFAALLVTGGVVTTVHTSIRSRGVRGISSTQGAMYGWAWCLGFTGIGTLGFAVVRATSDQDLVAMVMTIASTTLVAALYMAGGAIWGDRVQFTLGAWIAVTTIASAVVGYPQMQLVMAVAGGGGMLVAGAIEAVRRRPGGSPQVREAAGSTP